MRIMNIKIRNAPYVLVLTVVLCLSALLGACGKKAEPDGQAASDLPPVTRIVFEEAPDTIVARYDGGVVGAGDFAAYLNFMQLIDPSGQAADGTLWEQILDDYVGLHILAQRAKAQGDVTDSKDPNSATKDSYDALVSQLKAVYGDRGYAERLQALGLSDDDVHKFVSLYAAADAYLTHVKSDDELRADYEARKGDYTLTTVRHILIKVDDKRGDDEARALAEELARRAKGGENFAKLADEYSEDPGNTNPDGSKNGGLYENVMAGQWVPPFKAAALSQPIGEVGAPVKTDYGYHVIVVEARKEQSFEDVRELLVGEAAREAYQAFREKELPELIGERHIPKAKAS